MIELIDIASYIKNIPLEQKDGKVTLFAEAWRNKNTKKAVDVKISLEVDLWLDCLNVSDDENVILTFSTEDSWKDLLSVFSKPEFAFVVDKDFSLMLESGDGMITLKEF